MQKYIRLLYRFGTFMKVSHVNSLIGSFITISCFELLRYSLSITELDKHISEVMSYCLITSSYVTVLYQWILLLIITHVARY